jgi:hypothetical protein
MYTYIHNYFSINIVDSNYSYCRIALTIYLYVYQETAAVLALAIEDWIDFAIIMAILLTNGILGFTEELKSKV